MARWYGDEEGILWEDIPVILPASKGKRVDFNPNVRGREGYTPPGEYRSILGLSAIGLDIETKDPDLKEKGSNARRKGIGKIVGVALGYATADAVYYPTAHANTERNIPDADAFYARLADDAQRYEGEIVCANGQYDLDWLDARHGITFPKATIRDVQVAEPLLDENRLSFGLEALSRDYLGFGKETATLTDLYGKDYISHMDMVDPGHAADYAQVDVTNAWQVLERQLPALEQQGLTDLFNLESALTPLLLQMRRHGVRVDLDRAHQALEMTKKVEQDTQAEIKREVGFTVDIWSAQSVARAFDHLSISYPRTARGAPSFTKEWLNAHPSKLARMIVDQRAYQKIGSTFIDSYILNGHIDGRIHCMFNQLRSDSGGTVSGRFSSSNPNLQNIPARHDVLGPLCRSIFIPEDDCDWGSADWSQIEYRLLVHFAARTRGIDASAAVKAYREDPRTDFHEMAARITGVPRKIAKNINFGVVYGMGVELLAASLGIPQEEAAKMMDQFHELSPFIRGIYNTASNRAINKGFIRTILGRRRRFPVVECGGRFFQSMQAAQEALNRGEVRGRPRVAFTHKALNALLQGSAADLMKKAMVDMHRAGLFNVLVPHLTVHDEMDVSVPRTAEGREAFREMQHMMETAIELEIPVLADAKLGANWSEAK